MAKVSLHFVPLCRGLQALLEVFEGIRENPVRGSKQYPEQSEEETCRGFQGWLIKHKSVCETRRQMHTNTGMYPEVSYSSTLKDR